MSYNWNWGILFQPSPEGQGTYLDMLLLGLAWTVAIATLTVGLVVVARKVIPAEKVCPDFICFWTAGELLASGQSPYDIAQETEIQQRLGWNKDTDGAGLYGCLPYFYPPWFGLVCMFFLPLGYSTAKIAWLVINIELLVFSGVFVRKSVAGERCMGISLMRTPFPGANTTTAMPAAMALLWLAPPEIKTWPPGLSAILTWPNTR